MDRLASMETFVRVVETGSFSGAARDLNIGQPTVSKTIAQLETRLGVKLLTRSTCRLMSAALEQHRHLAYRTDVTRVREIR
jgi:DNA-binding transcriptional LysR family regulator